MTREGFFESGDDHGGVFPGVEASQGQKARMVVDSCSQVSFAAAAADPQLGAVHKIHHPQIVGVGFFEVLAGLGSGLELRSQPGPPDVAPQSGFADAV